MTSPAPAHGDRPAMFVDGLGARTVIAEKGGEVLEMLRITPAFALVPRFEAALRERVSRLANFRHAYFARVRRVDRLDGAGAIGVVSEHPTGARLSHVLAIAERHNLELDINAALCLVRQLVPAIATLHQNARDVAHGALAPERILVTSHARIVVTDHVLGSALEQLRLSRERLWRDLQIAAPSGAGHPRLDHRADVMQLGVVTLSLVLGRRLRPGDLRVLPELVASATENTVLGERAALSAPLRRWLLRALQADSRGSYESAADAQRGLDDVLSDEGGYIAAPVALEAFLRRYQEIAAHVEAASESFESGGSEPEPTPVNADVSRPADAASVAVPAPRDDSPPESSRAREHPPPERAHRQAPAEDAAGASAPVRDDQEAREGAGAPPGRARAAARAASTPDALTHVRDPSPEAPAADTAPAEDAAADPESELEAVAAPRRRWERIALVACLVVAVLEGVVIWWLAGSSGVLGAMTATVSIESRPAGLAVVVDGQQRGTTPVTVDVKPGARVLELRAGRESRVLPLHVEAGRAYSQYVELPVTEPTGAIEIREYRGARVLVDGQLRGVAPLKIPDLTPGTHELVLETRVGRVRQSVEVRPGLTTTFGTTITAGPSVAAPAEPQSSTGSLRVTAPYEMQVMAAGRLLGTTGAGAFELSAGRHQIEVISTTLGFRTVRQVDVAGGRESIVAIELPRGALTLDSTPPAEVWIDGSRLGETPMIDVPVTIGPHEITFKHPEHGEQHHAVVVTAATPARVRARFE